MRSLCSIVAVCAIGVAGGAALATPITVNFAGTFSQVIGNPYPGAAVGDTFTGSMSYESSTPPTSTNPPDESSYYANSLTAMSVTVQTAGGPVTITADTFNGILGAIGNPAAGQTVVNDQPDIFNASRVIDSFNSTAGNSVTNTALALTLTARTTIPDYGPLTSQALPENLILSQFAQNVSMQFGITGPGFDIANAQLSSLQVVPAPAGSALLVLSGAGIFRRRRRRAH